ncbi:hypothetical protein WR25_23855 [Diploscapter pachys]|uniref:Uncharacterized protein n=1 Tax=Diploscapter pachys TaxID=2018661 RepID=A0A2A2J4L9_9BILA|nr:hypothetical protein WR25_23855 [Diploscapter pachys]
MCRQSDRERRRELSHFERRQALKTAQREAVLSGRSVRSVIEDEVEPEPTACAKLTCVRTMPKVSSHYEMLDHDDIYRRLNETPHRHTADVRLKPPSIQESPQLLGAVPNSSKTSNDAISKKSIYIKHMNETFNDNL